MRETMIHYFQAEKRGAVQLLSLTGGALLAALLLVVTKTAYQPMAWPLAVFALIEGTVGVALFARTPWQVAAVLAELERAPQAALRGEVERVTRVLRSFALVLAFEAVVLAIGMVMMLGAAGPTARAAIGLGLTLQAGALLVFDIFARRRSADYLSALRNAGTTPVATVAPAAWSAREAS